MDSMSGGGQAMGGGRSGSGGGGIFGGTGRTVGGVGNAAGDPLDRAATTTATLGDPADAGVGANTNAAVQTAGHGDLNLSSGAHAQAAARAVPHPTGIPGVMLAGSSSASGIFSASRKNVAIRKRNRDAAGNCGRPVKTGHKGLRYAEASSRELWQWLFRDR